MVTKEEVIETSKLKFVFEQAKKQTADIVIIPQFLHNSTGSFDIAGIASNSITSSSRFQVFESFHEALWNDSSLFAMGLWYKDISPFLKVIGDHGVKQLIIKYNVYEVNGNNVGLAESLTTATPIMIKNSNGEPQCVFSPILPLLHIIEPYNKVKANLSLWSMLPKIMEPIVLTDDELFTDIWSGKTSDGALAWKPDINRYPERLRPYIIYLSKCMFAFSKSDKVYLEFRDKTFGPNFYNEFMCMITVQRVSKKQYSTHTYLFHGIKVV